MGRLRPLKGDISINGRLRIGYFTQHSADKFDLKLSAIENMLITYESSNPSDQEMRSFLGKFEIQGNDALKPMMMLSGGQKSRVAFASLCYQKPHVIIFDEREYGFDFSVRSSRVTNKVFFFIICSNKSFRYGEH